MLRSNERAWSVVLPDTCGFKNGPQNHPHRAIEGRGINLSLMVKNQNGEFLFIFWTICRKFISKVGFFPIVHKF